MPRRARRTFTPEFKAQIVRDLLSGTHSQAEVCREHQLSPSLVALWKDQALDHLPAVFQGDDRLSHEQTRIAELEQLAGRQALELEILKKASRRLPGTPRLNGRS